MDRKVMELKLCPFCGKQTTPVFSTVQDCEMCANFEDERCPECYENNGNDGCIHFVVCDVNRGGCGASTGWYIDKESALEAWNRRAKDDK